MKFAEIAGREELEVMFEIPDEGIGFHELPVAVAALGSFVAARADRPRDYLPAAKLGVRLGRLEIRDNETSKLRPVNAELATADTRTMAAALREYIDDTKMAIQAAMRANNPAACSARAVEASMAITMLRQAHEVIYPATPNVAGVTVGFESNRPSPSSS